MKVMLSNWVINLSENTLFSSLSHFLSNIDPSISNVLAALEYVSSVSCVYDSAWGSWFMWGKLHYERQLRTAED
jgi:hypothetical protein